MGLKYSIIIISSKISSYLFVSFFEAESQIFLGQIN